MFSSFFFFFYWSHFVLCFMANVVYCFFDRINGIGRRLHHICKDPRLKEYSYEEDKAREQKICYKHKHHLPFINKNVYKYIFRHFGISFTDGALWHPINPCSFHFYLEMSENKALTIVERGLKDFFRWGERSNVCSNLSE